MTPRKGVTLTEVLITIFVMAIGMISILILFVVGVQNMAVAINDNRIAQIAANVESVAEFQNLRNDPLVVQAATNYTYPQNLQGHPSIPVFVDAIGYEIAPGVPVGAGAQVGLPMFTGLPRVAPVYAPSGQARRWFAVHDEIAFDEFGAAVGGGALEREFKFSWAYIWKRPRHTETSVVDLAAVIFYGRPVKSAFSTSMQGEPAFRGPQGGGTIYRAFEPNSRQAVVALVGNSPNNPAPVRKGDWIMDTTVGVVPPGAHPQDVGTFLANGYFYRIIEISDPQQHPQTGEWVQYIDLHQPVRSAGYVGVYMFGVSDVIEKSDGRLPQK